MVQRYVIPYAPSTQSDVTKRGIVRHCTSKIAVRCFQFQSFSNSIVRDDLLIFLCDPVL